VWQANHSDEEYKYAVGREVKATKKWDRGEKGAGTEVREKKNRRGRQVTRKKGRKGGGEGEGFRNHGVGVVTRGRREVNARKGETALRARQT